MNDRFDIVRSEPDLRTIEGLRREVAMAVVRYFAPAVAIARELSTTAGLPTTWWMSRELDKDRADQSRR